MSADDLIALLKAWYTEEERTVEALVARRSECPSIVAVYLHVVESLELSEAHVEHLDSCPTCSRLHHKIANRRLGHSRHLTFRLGTFRLKRKWPTFAGLATAAAIAFAFLVVHAIAFDLREVGYAKPIPLAGAMLDPSESE